MEPESQVFEFYLHHSFDFSEDSDAYDIEQDTDFAPVHASFYEAYQAYLRRHH